jgi:hypothetical protein
MRCRLMVNVFMATISDGEAPTMSDILLAHSPARSWYGVIGESVIGVKWPPTAIDPHVFR